MNPRTAIVALVFFATSASAQTLVVSPRYIDFGEIKMGAQATTPVTIRNLGAAAANLAGGGFSGASAFSALGGTCSGGVVPAGGSCTINYHFRPTTASDAFTAQTMLQVTGNGEVLNANLAFRGAGGEALVQVFPRRIDFGEELIGQSVAVPVTITNTHSTAVNFAGGGISGFFSATGNCPPNLAPGASCQFIYSFTPGQVAPATGNTLIFVGASSPALGQNFSIELSGRGRTTPGAVHTAPVQLDFGAIKVGASVQSLVAHSNRTGASMLRAGGGFSDNDNAFFGFGSSQPGCGAGAMPAASTCSTIYGFLPRERRPHQASTFVEYSQSPAFFQAQSFSFTGTGVGTLARISPTEVDFGDIDASVMVTVPVVVLNTSPVPLTSILGGNVSAPFSRTSTCGSTLAAGASCTLTYRFQPLQDGNFAATTFLSYQANGAQETTQIVLAGTSGSAIFINGFE